MKKILIVIACILLLQSCGLVYKQSIRQGNFITQDKIDELKIGMTKRMVLLIMGSPAIENPFGEEQWNYVTSLKKPNQQAEVKHFIVHFENDRVINFSGDYEQSSDDGTNDKSDEQKNKQ